MKHTTNTDVQAAHSACQRLERNLAHFEADAIQRAKDISGGYVQKDIDALALHLNDPETIATIREYDRLRALLTTAEHKLSRCRYPRTDLYYERRATEENLRYETRMAGGRLPHGVHTCPTGVERIIRERIRVLRAKIIPVRPHVVQMAKEELSRAEDNYTRTKANLIPEETAIAIATALSTKAVALLERLYNDGYTPKPRTVQTTLAKPLQELAAANLIFINQHDRVTFPNRAYTSHILQFVPAPVPKVQLSRLPSFRGVWSKADRIKMAKQILAQGIEDYVDITLTPAPGVTYCIYHEPDARASFLRALGKDAVAIATKEAAV